MDSGINEGFANEIGVQAETSLGSTVTGTARSLPGKVSFSFAPQLEGGIAQVNLYRASDGDSYSRRFYTGQIELEYSHGETIALLLSSLLRRTGTSPNYLFTPYHLSARQSLAIGLSYVPNGRNYVFRGALIESASFTVRARELVKVKFEFKAATLTTDGPLTSMAVESRVVAAGHQAALEYNETEMPRTYDSSFQIVHRVEFSAYDESAAPSAYVPAGRMTVSADLAEFMSNDFADGNIIFGQVNTLNAVDASISVVPAAGKLLELTMPRVLTRSGTPQGIDRTGTGYRAGVEAQSSEARADVPLLTMTL